MYVTNDKNDKKMERSIRCSCYCYLYPDIIIPFKA